MSVRQYFQGVGQPRRFLKAQTRESRDLSKRVVQLKGVADCLSGFFLPSFLSAYTAGFSKKSLSGFSRGRT
jgi:hypothetical protein